MSFAGLANDFWLAPTGPTTAGQANDKCHLRGLYSRPDRPSHPIPGLAATVAVSAGGMGDYNAAPAPKLDVKVRPAGSALKSPMWLASAVPLAAGHETRCEASPGWLMCPNLAYRVTIWLAAA